jgi:hypothetical protein
MHSATCPACGTQVELDFKPVAGVVWCSRREKTFTPPADDAPPEPPSPDQINRADQRNGPGC